MQKDVIRDTIARLAIPRGTVAKLSGLYLSDLSAWLNNRAELNPVKVLRVAAVVEAIQEIVLASPDIKFDWRDPANAATLVTKMAQFKSETALQDAEADLQRVMGEAASVFNLTLS